MIWHFILYRHHLLCPRRNFIQHPNDIDTLSCMHQCGQAIALLRSMSRKGFPPNVICSSDATSYKPPGDMWKAHLVMEQVSDDWLKWGHGHTVEALCKARRSLDARYLMGTLQLACKRLQEFYAALSLFCDGFEHFEDITIRVQVCLYVAIFCREVEHVTSHLHTIVMIRMPHTHISFAIMCIHIIYICMHATQAMYDLSFIYPARIGIPCHLLYVEGMPRLYPHYRGQSWCCFPCGCSWVSLELQNS